MSRVGRKVSVWCEHAGANRGANESSRAADRFNGGYAAGLGTHDDDLVEEFELALRACWSHKTLEKRHPTGHDWVTPTF